MYIICGINYRKNISCKINSVVTCKEDTVPFIQYIILRKVTFFKIVLNVKFLYRIRILISYKIDRTSFRLFIQPACFTYCIKNSVRLIELINSGIFNLPQYKYTRSTKLDNIYNNIRFNDKF